MTQQQIANAKPNPGNYKHPYADVNRRHHKTYYDYESFEYPWSGPEPYLLHQKIGRGKYSEVFSATNRLNNEICVVKMLKPVKPKRLNREVLILHHLAGVPNVISLYDMVWEPKLGVPAFVTEHVKAAHHKQLFPTLTPTDLRYYFYEICRTLDMVHSMGIMHRDIKPQNICIDPSCRKLRIIDWGLAEFFHNGCPYNLRVASRCYKGPELLAGVRQYDYSLDLWSVGCMLAAILFRKDIMFNGEDNDDQLVKICEVLGTDDLELYCRRCNVPYPGFVKKKFPKKPWTSFLAPHKTPLATPDAIDFLDKLLQMDHTKRLTASQALGHKFFDPVRASFPPHQLPEMPAFQRKDMFPPKSLSATAEDSDTTTTSSGTGTDDDDETPPQAVAAAAMPRGESSLSSRMNSAGGSGSPVDLARTSQLQPRKRPEDEEAA